MKKIGNFFRNFMQGRNGTDDLAKVVLWIAIACYLLSLLTKQPGLYMLGIAGIAYALYRCMSKDIMNRSAENRRFQKFLSLQKLKWEQRKDYKIFACKRCGRTIRVPKKKGKIEVTCPTCGHKSIHRT
ncbi:MAG: hypothetical protein IJZ55_11795 [Lachnospiraceae bacterium]|nr:hypothetical protein [Lachnospiraceae bacterium]